MLTFGRSMLAALPFLTLGCLLLLFRQKRGSWRHALLPAALSWGALLTFLTELLSVARRLSAPWLAGAWFVVGLGVLALWHRGRHGHPEPAAGAGATLDRFDRLLLGGACVIVLATGVVAVAAPPNTWDSMSYHMSRVAHWARNRSVAHYPTHLTRQLAQPPGSEFVILQGYVLGGTDRWANVGQFAAFIGSLVLVMLIAERLGAGPRGQVLAAVACATLPIAVLTATSTQNDLEAGFWLMSFVYFMLGRSRDRGREAPGTGDAVWLGLGLGLAMLTKALTYVLAIPFVLWLAALELRMRGRRALRPLATVALVALAVNAGHYARNLSMFGSPIGMAEYPVQNEIHTPKALLSTTVRNVSLHLSSAVPALDAAVERAILWLHGAVGVDPQDPRTTWPGTHFAVDAQPFNEDLAGSPLQLLLAVVAAALALRRPRDPVVIGLNAALVAAFLIFCAYLKWQPWHVRLHLPLFVGACALIGLSMERWPAGVSRTIAVVLLLSAVPYVLWNETRPLVGERSVLRTPRLRQYFAAYPDLQPVHERVAAAVVRGGCRQIGLLMKGDSWEYPFWVLLNARRAEGPQLHHVRVTNPSGRAREPGDAAPPCALIVVGRRDEDAYVTAVRRRALDFDGDGASDFALYHPATRLWYLRNSGTGEVRRLDFGAPDAVPVAQDYDGDGRADVAVYHPATGLWFVEPSSTGGRTTLSLGGAAYAPVRGDFDGDGKADPAVYQAASGLWYMRLSATGTVTSVQHGGPDYVPVPCDYDGDGRTDVAAYHRASGLWFLRLSRTGEASTTGFGEAGDRPVPGDFDGDGRCDLAVYRAREGRWFIKKSTTGIVDVVELGGPDAEPVAADYDGDGRVDAALYEARLGRWSVRPSWGTTLGPPTDFGGEGFLPAN